MSNYLEPTPERFKPPGSPHKKYQPKENFEELQNMESDHGWEEATMGALGHDFNDE